MNYSALTDVYYAKLKINNNSVHYYQILVKSKGIPYYTSKQQLMLEDLTPPSLLNILWAPLNPITGENVSIYLWAYDDYGISRAILSYYIDGWHNITMQYNSSIGAYVAVVPGLLVNGTLLFKVYVFDTVGHCTISKVYGISFSSIVSETSPKESAAFGVTTENVVVITFTAVISLLVGLGIGLHKKGSK
ncbi:MAG: hypothetical protein ACP6IS_07885 [Candidatus Asgardarchaeia archaeon]